MNSAVEEARQSDGFLPVSTMIDKFGATNTILDEGVLISEKVELGGNNKIYPNVVIECTGEGRVAIGSNNTFYPGTFISASAGSITIGDDNEFGSDGCSVKANVPEAIIVIGDGGRYSGGASIMGQSSLGGGSQILGNITVQGCTLQAGGTYVTPDPDERAAVLKGFGLARNITLEKGQVINGSGNFADASVEWQRSYHPKPKTNSNV